MKGARRAVIDIGTNSVKLLVADVEGAEVRPVREESRQTRLGQGLYTRQRLQAGPIAKTAAAAAEFAARARDHQAASIRVIATSAARDALNSQELTDAIERSCGLRVEIISGAQEADLVFQGVTSDPALAAMPLVLLDVGGGTGTMRQLWPADCRYVCLDIEMPKLQGFRSKVADGLALQTDATRMPIASGCADSVVCTAVAHHLTDTMLSDVLRETVRVLKPGGRMFFLDPVFARDRIAGRVIWRLDRGSYPRTAEVLRDIFGRHLEIAHWERFAIHHEYVFGVGIRV